MGLTKSVKVDIPMSNMEIPDKHAKKAIYRAKEAFNNVGINPDEYVISQQVFIRNTIIRKK